MKAKKKYAVGGMVIGGALQGTAGLAQTIYGGVQAKRARKELERVRASAPSLETPSEYMRLYKEAFNNDLLGRQMESIKSTAGSSIAALGQAGGRALLGGIQGVSQGAAMQSQQAIDQQQLRQMGALEALAGANRQTQQMKEGRYQQELGMAQEFMDASVQNIGAGIGAMGMGAMYAASGIEGNPFKRKSKSTGTTPSNDPSSPIFDLKTGAEINSGPRPTMSGRGRMEDGGVVKTDGKFSHDKNPIDMIQKGEKVGEMTGGEYIFNPDQMSNIKSLVKSSPEKLQKYIKGLIKKFEK